MTKNLPGLSLSNLSGENWVPILSDRILWWWLSTSGTKIYENPSDSCDRRHWTTSNLPDSLPLKCIRCPISWSLFGDDISVWYDPDVCCPLLSDCCFRDDCCCAGCDCCCDCCWPGTDEYRSPNSRASFSSCACCLRRATCTYLLHLLTSFTTNVGCARFILTWAAITRWRSAINVHLAHTQSRHRQYRLWPFRALTCKLTIVWMSVN